MIRSDAQGCALEARVPRLAPIYAPASCVIILNVSAQTPRNLVNTVLNSPTISPAKQTPTPILLQPAVEWGLRGNAIGQL
jgi:hypothetical protein